MIKNSNFLIIKLKSVDIFENFISEKIIEKLKPWSFMKTKLKNEKIYIVNFLDC